MSSPKAILYASQIKLRKRTILDVPDRYREEVLGLLSESERKRQAGLLA
ncbi:hypothetical protein GMI70_06860 [Eggerthellaceae bacterium zg-893]|nr:hypothetical protein [Eggerthellaceae bacterium zg-893]